MKTIISCLFLAPILASAQEIIDWTGTQYNSSYDSNLSAYTTGASPNLVGYVEMLGRTAKKDSGNPELGYDGGWGAYPLRVAMDTLEIKQEGFCRVRAVTPQWTSTTGQLTTTWTVFNVIPGNVHGLPTHGGQTVYQNTWRTSGNTAKLTAKFTFLSFWIPPVSDPPQNYPSPNIACVRLTATGDFPLERRIWYSVKNANGSAKCTIAQDSQYLYLPPTLNPGTYEVRLYVEGGLVQAETVTFAINSYNNLDELVFDPRLGDITGDGVIDIADYFVLASVFDQANDEPIPPPLEDNWYLVNSGTDYAYADGDLNWDGVTDVLDYTILATHFDQSSEYVFPFDTASFPLGAQD